jgi:hypothetical protein
MQIEFKDPESFQKYYSAHVTDESGSLRVFHFGLDVPKERALKMLPILFGDGRRKRKAVS